MNIPITKPYFGEEERQAILKPLESGWVVQGPFVEEFEQKFGAFTNAAHSIATSSCTTALHIAVAALRLRPGDEVIVPAFTWVSTANVVEYMGAKPVFCDIDLKTFNIDVEKIESLITPKTVGIIPVHLFGLCAEMDPILDLAQRHGLWVVEDAACALGAWNQDRHAGTMGTMGCFSFHPRKSITTGEGGMITTQEEGLDRLSRSLRDHGASRSDFDRHEGKASFLLSEYNELGFNFRMTDLQGAVGAVQMDRAAWILEQRKQLACHYDTLLNDLPWLHPPYVPETMIHGYQAYVCLYAPEAPSMDNAEQLHRQRNDLMTTLENQGIATRQGTHAVVMQGYYKNKYGFTPEQFPSAYLADRLSLTLPLYATMTDEMQRQVVEALQTVANDSVK